MAAGRPAAARKAGKGPVPAKPPSVQSGHPEVTGKPEQDKPAATPKTENGPANLAAVAGGGSAVDTGAGFLLGLLFWGWVAVPFLHGGPAEVKKVLRAKFFNKAPDGSWLP